MVNYGSKIFQSTGNRAHQCGTHKPKLLHFLANIGLGWKYLTVTNTSAYNRSVFIKQSNVLKLKWDWTKDCFPFYRRREWFCYVTLSVRSQSKTCSTACRYIIPIMADINIGALVFKFQIDGTFDLFDKVAVVRLVEWFLHLLDSQTSIFIYLQTYFL